MNNLTMEYETKLKEIKVLIYNIGKIGIDCTLYNKALEKLDRDFSNELIKLERNKKIDINSKNKLINRIYNKYLVKLSELKVIITENKIYFDIKKKLLYIDQILKTNITNSDLNNCISDLLECINSIRKHNTSYFKEKNEIINELYKMIYKASKQEIKFFGTSKLLSYCKNNGIGISYLNELILQNIENIKGYGNVFEINKYLENLSSTDDYIDEELIRLLITFETKEYYTQSLKDIESLKEQKVSEIRVLKKNIRKVSDKKFNKKAFDIKKIMKYSFSILLSVGTIFGALKGTSNIKDKSYRTTLTTYTQNDDSYETQTSYETKDSHKDEILIRMESPYKKIGSTYQRKIEYAYIEKESLNNLSDYLELVSEEQIDFKTTREYKKFLDVKDRYTEKVVKITEKDIDYSDYNVEKSIIKQTLCYVLIALLVIVHDVYGSIISFSTKKSNNYNEISLGTLSYIYYLVRYAKKLQKDLKLTNEELEALCAELGYKEDELKNIKNAQEDLRISHTREMSDLFIKSKDDEVIEDSGMVRRLGK